MCGGEGGRLDMGGVGELRAGVVAWEMLLELIGLENELGGGLLG